MATRSSLSALGMICAVLVSFNANSIEVYSATRVYVQGVPYTKVVGKADRPYANITMDSEVVAQSQGDLNFSFRTPLLGHACIARVGDEDYSHVDVVIKNCDSTPRGFYMTDQVQHSLPAQTSDPLFTIEIKATCDPGDMAINWFGGSPKDFAIRYSGLVRYAGNNEESWLLIVHSLANVDSTIGMGAVCADMLPRHLQSNQPEGN